MKWKLLIILDTAFSTLTVISASVLGNRLIAGYIPNLHDNATWLSKLVLRGLTLPDALAHWALGTLPRIATLFLFGAFFLAELLLIIGTPLVNRFIAAAIARKYQQDVDATYQLMRKNRSIIRPLRHRLLGRVTLRVAALSVLAFLVGLFAALIAWGVAALINANTGGIVQTAAIVFAVILLLFVSGFLSEIVPAAMDDENEFDGIRDLALDKS
jgi:hypothetical protein